MVWYPANTVQHVLACNWAELPNTHGVVVKVQSQLELAWRSSAQWASQKVTAAQRFAPGSVQRGYSAFADSNPGAIGLILKAAALEEGWCLVTFPAASFCELQFCRPAWSSCQPMEGVRATSC